MSSIISFLTLIVKVGVSSWKVAPAVDESTFRIKSFRVTSGDVTIVVLPIRFISRRTDLSRRLSEYHCL